MEWGQTKIQEMVSNHLQDKIAQYKNWKQQTDSNYANQQSAKMENDTMNLYESWLQATDKQTKQQYNVASRGSLLAEMISNTAREKGYELTWNASDIVSSYLQWFPEAYDSFMNFTHSDQDPEEFAIQMWWIEAPQKESNFFTNVVWWAYDSVTWLPRMIGKWTADAIWWVAKQFWADEDKVNALVNDYKNYLDSDWSGEAIGADKDSATYKISKGVWDLTQTLTAWWLAKNAIKWTALWKVWMDAIKQAPLGYKAAAWAIEWAADMWLYNMISESELPSGEDLLIGGALWAVSPVLWAWMKAWKWLLKEWTKKTAAKLELSWMLNPAKLDNVKNMLIEEWTDLASAWLKWWTAEDVGVWMIERWMKWEKPEIVAQLWSHASKARNLKRQTLAWSTTTHNVESADWILDTVYNLIAETPWLEQKTARVSELLSKRGNYTLSELDEIKTIWDEILQLFKNNWELKAWVSKMWLWNLRADLRKYIEDAATKEWLWNIKMLNNEIQVAKALEQWISRKDSADMARDMLSIFWPYVVGGWFGSAVWPFDNSSIPWKVWNMIIGALAGKYLFSTKAKTTLAAKLNKLSGGSQKELSRLVAGESTKLSKKTEKELMDILKDVEALPLIEGEVFTAEELWNIADYIQPSLF